MAQTHLFRGRLSGTIHTSVLTLWTGLRPLAWQGPEGQQGPDLREKDVLVPCVSRRAVRFLLSIQWVVEWQQFQSNRRRPMVRRWQLIDDDNGYEPSSRHSDSIPIDWSYSVSLCGSQLVRVTASPPLVYLFSDTFRDSRCMLCAICLHSDPLLQPLPTLCNVKYDVGRYVRWLSVCCRHYQLHVGSLVADSTSTSTVVAFRITSLRNFMH